MTSREKIEEISALQSFGIVLVVIGHSFAEINTYPQDSLLACFYWLHGLIYSFHMPLFMFISGFLFFYTNIGRDNRDYGQFIIKKFNRLIVPYLAISLVVFPIKAAMSRFALRPVDFSVMSIVDMIFYPTHNAILYFWFLPTLFIIFIISPVFLKAVSKRSLVVISLLTAALLLVNAFNPVKTLFLNLNGVVNYALFFWLGCVSCLFKEQLLPVVRNKAAAVLFTVFLLAMNYFKMKAGFFYALTAVSGIAVSMHIVFSYPAVITKMFSFIEGYSYQIYLVSWFPQVFFKLLIYDYLGWGFYLTFVLALASGLTVPVIVSKYVKNRLPRLKFAIGL
ncbi:MAG: acyltransferase [Endomicrobiales bacterium]|nr:acyltransferase [Endomicrobiales bacterium]